MLVHRHEAGNIQHRKQMLEPKSKSGVSPSVRSTRGGEQDSLMGLMKEGRGAKPLNDPQPGLVQ